MKTLTATTNKGESLQAGLAPFHLISFEGYGETEADNVVIKGVRTDGVTYVESFLEPKQIPVVLKIVASGEMELHERRQLVGRIFNPKNGLLTVTYEDESGPKEIRAVSEHMPKFGGSDQRRNGIFQNVLITLLAPHPYWRKTEAIDKPLYAWIGMHTFPFVFGTTTTPLTVFGRKGEAESITNTGGAGAPVTITITGYVDTPTIRNLTTGEHITLNTIIEEDERVEISTDDEELIVDLIGPDGTRTDIYFRLSADSKLWKLDEGENVLEYTSISQTELSTVSISYHELYAGI